MAEPVKALPVGKGGRTPYPEEWFNGKVWKVVPGVDVAATKVKTLQSGLTQSARLRGFKSVTRARDGWVFFQVTGTR
jgi:hypothetical protein